eukprot:TRINITY_DN3603_c0_g1_i2.p1 TRINITY_DN3603_c0_g1~~TRINITY_DN3603_c0_g1_i2.p1  ORF type:complete len:232 (+),score=64.99 TRINITY_DN3603_c0_g1_i2:65-760(+)
MCIRDRPSRGMAQQPQAMVVEEGEVPGLPMQRGRSRQDFGNQQRGASTGRVGSTGRVPSREDIRGPYMPTRAPAPAPPKQEEDSFFPPEFANQLRNQQITQMIEILQPLYSESRLIMEKLRTARGFANIGNYEAAADILTQIVFSPSATRSEKEMFNKIIVQVTRRALDMIESRYGRQTNPSEQMSAYGEQRPRYQQQPQQDGRRGGQGYAPQERGGYQPQAAGYRPSAYY